jgi:hypothetical protein
LSPFAGIAVIVSVGMWFGFGLTWSADMKKGKDKSEREEVDIHGEIEQMLAESGVILPGAQAMLGFQFIVTMTNAFNEMSAAARVAHFVALGGMILSTVLLISPAAVHRLGFAGADSARFHTIGARLITAALVPLAMGIALDLYVAAWRLSMSRGAALMAGVAAFSMLIGVWYVWPLSLRRTSPLTPRKGNCS